MRIIVTGATGAIGRATVPRLVGAGHDVTGVHHRDAGADWLRHQGVRPARVDLVRPAQGVVEELLSGADAVVHLATSIPPLAKMARPRHWATNDRLRADASRVLADAAESAGVSRLIVASITFNYADRGDHWISEDDPVAVVFPPTGSALAAEDRVERFAAAGGSGVSLRFAQLYGPGDVSAELVAALRRRRVPRIGAGSNYVSSIHVDDAAAAVVVALDAPSGTYNVADDRPLRARERLEFQAQVVGAPTPRHVPAPVARLLVGRAVRHLTASQRVLNRRLRDTTGWAPRYPSIREGWATVLGHEHTERSIP